MKLKIKESVVENNATESIKKEYEKYILEHLKNVKKAYEFIKKNLPEILKDCDIDKLDEMIKNHDASKYSEEEFMPYAEHFYGKTKGTKTEDDIEFQKAWKHHYETNSHHPQYWKGAEMDQESIIEMICDWWSFGWKKNNLYELIDFYESNIKQDKEEDLNLNSKTKTIIEKYLYTIKTFLNNQTKE